MVIGWDGATFKVLDKMLKAGIMPNLKSLIQRGVRANLLSTIPPITGPAWTSFRTGKMPENHGLFSFLKPPDFNLNITDIKRHNARNIDGLSFWNVFNLHNKSAIIADMPLTDPVEKIDGIMISGMMTRGKRGVLTYPEDTKDELKKRFTKYFDKSVSDGLGVSLYYLNQLIDSLREKLEMDLFLLNHHPWDLFVTVYSAVDTLQHCFWGFIDEKSVQYKGEEKYQKRIKEFFSVLDQILYEYLNCLEDNDNLIIVSDHGFGPSNYIWYVNNFLLNQGLLKLTKRGMTSFINMETMKKIIYKLDFFNLKRFVKKETRERFSQSFAQKAEVDWLESKAFFRAKNEYGIYLNLKERYDAGVVERDEYHSIIQDLKIKLKNLKNPFDGKAIFKDIYSKYEIYAGGKYTEDAPDIILVPEPGVNCAGFDLSNLRRIVKINKDFLSGFHEQEGIFVGFGRDFKSGYRSEPFYIYDLAPTLLFLSGLPVDEKMDGKVIKEILHEKLQEKDVNVEKYEFIKKFLDDGSENNNEREQIEQLKGPGYID